MITDHELGQVLSDWNFWHQDMQPGLPGHPRRLTETILQVAAGREVVAVVGVRRCGKTTILYQLMERLVGQGNTYRDVLYINLEDHRLARHLDVELLDRCVSWFRHNLDPNGPVFVFLDEPQEIDGWERWVRSKYDRDRRLRIFVTGSSSRLMSSELSSLLTGRNLTFQARPFSYSEYLSFVGVAHATADSARDAHLENLDRRDELIHHLVRYIEHGGFPEVLTRQGDIARRTLLQQYFDDILVRDVVQRHHLRTPRQLRDLALVLMRSVSNLVSLGKLARTLGTSPSQVASLMDHLEQSHLVSTVRFFSHSLQESVSVQKPRKVYSVDPGMRNAVVTRASRDAGWLAENLVHGHLCALGHHPSYWKEDREVDFVLSEGPLPLNVCHADDIPEREIESLARFHERHGNDSAWLITHDTFDDRRLQGFGCTLCPLWAFLLSESL